MTVGAKSRGVVRVKSRASVDSSVEMRAMEHLALLRVRFVGPPPTALARPFVPPANVETEQAIGLRDFQPERAPAAEAHPAIPLRQPKHSPPTSRSFPPQPVQLSGSIAPSEGSSGATGLGPPQTCALSGQTSRPQQRVLASPATGRHSFKAQASLTESADRRISSNSRSGR